jgi:UDP-glucose 4-epimerase
LQQLQSHSQSIQLCFVHHKITAVFSNTQAPFAFMHAHSGEQVVVVDNLSNAVEDSLERVRELTGCDRKQLQFRKIDLLDRKGLAAVFNEFKFDSCIHFAGLKAVGESVTKPLKYYR